jgi:hypothetical protein
MSRKPVIGWEAESRVGGRLLWDQLAPEFDVPITSAYNARDDNAVLALFDNFYFVSFRDMTMSDSANNNIMRLRPIFGKLYVTPSDDRQSGKKLVRRGTWWKTKFISPK